MITTLKFGGTSMGTPESLGLVAQIIQKTSGQKAVVVSATSGTTDKLIALGKAAVAGENWQNNFDELIARHQKICSDLKIAVPAIGEFAAELSGLLQGIQLTHELSPSILDRIMSFGERMSEQILAAFLNSQGLHAQAVDAHDLVFTDNNFNEGNVDFARSNEAIVKNLSPLLDAGIVPIITGFIGQSADGNYITLGRGGSDYSGAIIAAALDAGELQVWTDVDGMLNADPRLIKEAKVLEQISFREASELAYFGAKVLHPKTIKPAIEKNIPVRILNTFNADFVGTIINNEEGNELKSVTFKKGISVINVCSAGMLEAHGFLAKIFAVFARHEVVVDVVSTSEVSVSITVEGNVPKEVLADLSGFCTVEVETGMAIVCLVGGGIKSDKEVLGRLFSAVRGYNIGMVSVGASKRNITFLVKETDAPEIVKKIFNEFFAS